MMTSSEIRKQFLDFFASRGHQIVPSAPIVVKNDPTLLFTNAGMNQFKDYFLGNKKPESTRIANTQKCLRVSGKHNDLEEVGVDTYHHTMFEMLGNWSFGDYFKTEAIAWSWELLTEVYKLDKDRLYVTVFEGDAREGLPKDEEALAEWKKWMAEDRILPGNKKDNFWEMGDTGPCGPCTEIHVDCRTDAERKKVDGRTLVNNDHPQVLEIWNNVFIQFNRLKDGTLEPLPAKHVDTGMGFERLVRVLQEKQSNYDTDVFTGTLGAIEKITGKKYDDSDSKEAIAFRVLSDHTRAIAFTIADGQLPANNGAGYVIRRILRRAVRYYYTYLDYKQPLLFQLLPLLAGQFENVFPELHKQLDFVSKVVKEEEDAFLKTLDKGLKRIDDIIKSSGKEIEGKAAFELFDTFGFPIDLTRLIAAENNLLIDEKGFESEMQLQKTRSRSAGAVDTEDWVVLIEDGFSEFVGYDSVEIKSKLLKYRKVKAKGKEAYQLVLEATPFYAESGGQVGDTGTLNFDGEIISVTDTKKDNNLVIHFTESLPANIHSHLLAKVDMPKRQATTVHHSATHLLHAALRKVLGKHVAQKGSLVNEEQLRFDFSHFAKVSEEEIAEIERVVNEKIRENIPVHIKEMSKDDAIATGAMALFGEKYGDKVRVVIMDPDYSVELCGGTHVGATGELGFFRIKHETAVAAGVRRIEAVSGKAAEKLVNSQFDDIRVIREILKNPKEISKAVESLAADNNELKKRIESLEAKQLSAIKQELLQKTELINGITFIGSIVEVSNADSLKKLCFELKNSLTHYMVVLAAAIEGKAQVAILLDEAVSDTKNLEAPKLIKEQVAALIKGGGGGQKTLATAGGQDASNLQQVIDNLKKLVAG
ncbi:MAG: alanine--tRNA ligase [Chitinophagaceae bacterium]|nr:alanine--tRNA ligase [Chitinophagaceae bacterium]MDP1811012.1 alanine--tRNA ligase [Sediminibacterium sp.]MDP3128208.1 alanine--tRNA ligase [Sediminibacterium sp.]